MEDKQIPRGLLGGTKGSSDVITLQILVNGIAPVVTTDEMKQAALTSIFRELKKPDILLDVFTQNIAGILHTFQHGPPTIMGLEKRSKEVKERYEKDKAFRLAVNNVVTRLHFVTCEVIAGGDPT